MGIRHIAMFRWAEGTTSEQVAEVEGRLAELPEAIPQLRSYGFGRDLGIGAGNFDFVVVAEFADEADFAAYRDHPDHQAVLARLRPLLADRAAVQYGIPSR